MANKKYKHLKSSSKLVKIPARRGVAVHVFKGQKNTKDNLELKGLP